MQRSWEKHVTSAYISWYSVNTMINSIEYILQMEVYAGC